MDVDILDVPHDERGRLTGEALRRTLDVDGGDGRLRGGRERGRDERRDGRRPGGRRRGVRGARDLVPRRRRPTAAPACSPPRSGGSTTGSSARTPSSSTRTSGCSHRTTPAPCCTATRRWRRRAHRQEASYLDTALSTPDWNPADYAYHLSRRARGLPLWFSLATYGTDAYRDAIEPVLTLTRETARAIDAHPDLELADGAGALGRALPADRVGTRRLRVVVAAARSMPRSRSCNRPHGTARRSRRLCFVNPRTTIDHVRAVLETMV